MCISNILLAVFCQLETCNFSFSSHREVRNLLQRSHSHTEHVNRSSVFSLCVCCALHVAFQCFGQTLDTDKPYLTKWVKQTKRSVWIRFLSTIRTVQFCSSRKGALVWLKMSTCKKGAMCLCSPIKKPL